MAKAFVAGVVSLLIVAGAAARTAAGDPAQAPDKRAGVVELFGKVLCLPNAPADQRCDWRFPAAAPGAQEPARAPGTRTFRLLGLTWCLGDPADQTQCDFRVPSRPVTDTDAQARR